MSTEKWRKTFHPFRQWGDCHRSCFGVKNSSYFSLFIIVPSFVVMKTSTIILSCRDHRRFIQSLESHYERDFSLLFLLGRDYETHHELLLLGLPSGWSEKRANAEWSRVVYLFRLMTFFLPSSLSVSWVGESINCCMLFDSLLPSNDSTWLWNIQSSTYLYKFPTLFLSQLQFDADFRYSLTILFFFCILSHCPSAECHRRWQKKGKQVKLCRW